MLNYASNSGSVIWLNNKILLEEKYTIYKRFTYAQKYIPINLRKGNNLLLVKVRNDGKDWKMFAAIENFTEQGQRRHSILSVMDNYGDIMNSCMVENDTIEFGWWMPSNYYGDFNIRGKGVDTTFSVNSRPNEMDVSFLKDGFYRLSLFMAQDTIVQDFFKGDFHKAFKSRLTLLSKMDLDLLTRKNVEAYGFRYNHLLRPAHLPQMPYEFPNWKRKLMFLFKGINVIYENSINKERSSVPNINSYISKIDSAVQYYQLFAPNDYSMGEPLPLIVQLPVPVKRYKPYLATYHFADIDGSEKLKIVHNNKVIYEGYTDGDELTVGAQNGYSQDLVKNSLIEGPFAHVFLQPFIIVPGTIGDQKEIQLNNTIATQLAEMWDTMYYAKCHVMIDQNISENEIQNFNLILIGNEHNNKLLKQHNNIMPIRNTSNSVVINNEHFQGENLNYYMVYPNPARTDYYIAVLGYNNADRFLLMSENDLSPLENISYLGYYDYKVWTPDKVIRKSYFGRNW